MRIPNTKEMSELEKIYDPYFKNGDLVPDAPEEAKEAFEKYMELFREQYYYWEKFWQSE